MKLIGYSSDDLPANNQRFGKPTKSRHDRMHKFDERIKQGDYSRHQKNVHWFEQPTEKIIYHVYKVNGEFRYYLKEQALLTLKSLYGKNVSKQGIHYQSEDVKYVSGASNKVTTPIKKHICCYCEVELTPSMPPHKSIPTSETKEHLFPRHAGGKNGKNVRPACYQCNQEKGGLMLHSYIQVLNLMLLDHKPGDLEYLKLQTKIKNANRIAKEIEQ